MVMFLGTSFHNLNMESKSTNSTQVLTTCLSEISLINGIWVIHII